MPNKAIYLDYLAEHAVQAKRIIKSILSSLNWSK